MDLIEKYLGEESNKLNFKNDKHKKSFESIYNSKKKNIGNADRFEVSMPFMIKVLGKEYPGFTTSYRNKNGKMIHKTWAIDENGYDVYISK